MDSLRLVVVASLVAGTAASALADDIRVPQDVRNLKDALLVARPGDRVIVTGGTWRNGRVMVSGVRLIGHGATLTGLWEVYGTGSSIEGCTVRSGVIQVEADGVTLRRNRFVPPGNPTKVSGDGVSGLLLEDNRFAHARAEILHATDCVLRGNRFLDGSGTVYGDGTLAEDNVLRGRATLSASAGANAIVRNNTGGFISLEIMTNADVEGNSARQVYVRGSGALVADNEIPAGRWLSVESDDAVVRGNRVSSVTAAAGLSVNGDRVVVTDNVVDNLRTTRPRVGMWHIFNVSGHGSRGAGPSHVLRNVVTHRLLGGLRVEYDEAEVASNTVRGIGAASSLWLEGDRNNAHDNTIVREAEVDDTMTGISVAGADNVVTDTSVNQAPYDGVIVRGSGNLLARVHVGRAGRCGITVEEDATSTGVADCTVDAARWASLFVLGTDTTVTGGTFSDGGKVDVLDLGTGTEFVSTTYATKSEDAALRPYR
jgi:parallel beta helix pectate lyase-like protein